MSASIERTSRRRAIDRPTRSICASVSRRKPGRNSYSRSSVTPGAAYRVARTAGRCGIQATQRAMNATRINDA
jgi:hypothetical protein